MNGVYVLLIKICRNTEKNIGSLKKIMFAKGNYAYVGSAQKNLEKRVARHLSCKKKKFWHIDYLLDNSHAKVVKVFYKKAGKSEECKIAGRLIKRGRLVPNFGCSDCNCKSHLFKLRSMQDVLELGMEEI